MPENKQEDLLFLKRIETPETKDFQKLFGQMVSLWSSGKDRRRIGEESGIRIQKDNEYGFYDITFPGVLERDLVSGEFEQAHLLISQAGRKWIVRNSGILHRLNTGEIPGFLMKHASAFQERNGISFSPLANDLVRAIAFGEEVRENKDGCLYFYGSKETHPFKGKVLKICLPCNYISRIMHNQGTQELIDVLIAKKALERHGYKTVEPFLGGRDFILRERAGIITKGEIQLVTFQKMQAEELGIDGDLWRRITGISSFLINLAQNLVLKEYRNFCQKKE